MHPLVRAALALCPREYRAQYGAVIARDARTRRAAALAVAADIAYHGVAMRGETLARDVAFALRTLAKARTYTLITILTIALAMGPNIVVAGILSAVLLEPLPYPQPDRLVIVGLETSGPGSLSSISYPDARDIDALTRALEPVALAEPDSETLLSAGRARMLRGSIVNGTYFATLGARPLLGHLLGPEDAGRHSVVISENVWRNNFGADPGIVGHRLRFNGGTYTVAGVMPSTFREPLSVSGFSAAFWLPLDPHSPMAQGRGNWAYNALARLRPGVTLDDARVDVTRVVRVLIRKYPVNHVGTTGGAVLPVRELIVGDSRPLLTLLYAAVVAILAIACVNVANLTLARGAARAQELVVRTAVGASRGRIVTQLATECALLATAGALGGMVLAAEALRAVTPLAQRTLPRWDAVSIDARVLGYTAGLIALVTVCSGVLPALAQRRNIAEALKAAGRSADRAPRATLRAIFVIAQVALAITVAVTAGLVTRSFSKLVHTPTGFVSTNVYYTYISDVPTRYSTGEAVAVLAERVRRGIAAIPGVVAASAASELPFSGYSTTGVTIPDLPRVKVIAHINEIQPDYFSVLRLPLLAGRGFTRADRRDSAPVAIVNAAFARRYFGTLAVIGRRVTPGQWTYGPTPPVRTIVGVAGDARSSYSQPPAAQIFIPLAQVPRLNQFVFRTTGPIDGIQRAVGDALASIDRDIAPPPVQPITYAMAQSALHARAATVLFTTLAGIALLLTIAGTYAVAAYTVGGRTHEFGIRKAVGARNIAVVRDVVGKALAYGITGIVIGICSAAAVTKLLTSLLFETSPLDPATFTTVIALLAASTVFASLMPALTAMRIEPAHALRYE